MTFTEDGSPANTLQVDYVTYPFTAIGRAVRATMPQALTATVNMTADPETLVALPKARAAWASIYPAAQRPFDQGTKSEWVNRFAYSGYDAVLGAQNPILIRVDANGVPTLVDGEMRIHAAAAAGLKNLPVRFEYLGGSEQKKTSWQPRLRTWRGGGSTILASDAFNRANETPIASPWVNNQSSFDLVSGSARPHSNTDTEAYYSGVTWPKDQFSRGRLSVVGTSGLGSGIGLLVRQAVGVRTFYRLAVDHAPTGNVDITRFVSGAFVSILTATRAWVDGDEWELQAQGTTLRVLWSGAQVASVTDALVTAGAAGIAYSSSETSSSIADWKAGSL